jgi:MFS family permease
VTAPARASLLLVCASAFAYALVETGSYLVLPPDLVDRYHYDAAFVGVLLAVVGAASLAARFPVGKGYGAGRGPVLAAGGSLAGVASMALLRTPGMLPGLLLALCALGVALSIASTLQLATLSSLRQRGGLGSSIGWYTAAIGVGHTVSGVLAGWVGDRAGIPTVYAFVAVAAVAGTVLWAAGERMAARAGASTGPERAEAPTTADREAVTEGDEPSAAPAAPAGGVPLTRWVRRQFSGWDATLLAAFVLVLVMNTFNGSVSAFHPVMAVAAGLTLRQVGVLSSTRSLASTAVRIGAGVFLRRSNGERLIWPLVLLGAAAIALLPGLRASMLAQVPLFLGMGVSRGLLRITGSSVAMAGRTTPQERGRASATINAGLDLGKLVGPLAGSGLVAVAGLQGMFPMLAVAGIVAYWMASRPQASDGHDRS